MKKILLPITVALLLTSCSEEDICSCRVSINIEGETIVSEVDPRSCNDVRASEDYQGYIDTIKILNSAFSDEVDDYFDDFITLDPDC